MDNAHAAQQTKSPDRLDADHPAQPPHSPPVAPGGVDGAGEKADAADGNGAGAGAASVSAGGSENRPGRAGGDPVSAEVQSGLEPGAVVDRLAERSRRGKLPGFRELAAPASGARAFEADAFGNPYDRSLVGLVEPTPGGGSRLTFTLRTRWRLPIVVLVVLVLTVWPGVWLTDSLLTTYFGWYPRAFWVTAAWYLPLCALAVPVVIRQWKASKEQSAAHAAETVEKVRGWVG